MTQINFDEYNRDIILCNTHRIDTLRISNHFMFDQNVLILSEKTSLRTLILENIAPKSLNNILHQLTSLPHLSSLSISTVDRVENMNSIYQQIFCLSVLKYCKLSLGKWFPTETLSLTINNHSSIEHLIINDDIRFDQLDALFSYVPNLHRLSLQLLSEKRAIQNQSHCSPLKYLTHLYLTLDFRWSFNQLQQFMNYFSSIQVFYLNGLENKYMNAKAWEQIISLSLPNLRIFDVRFELRAHIDSLKESLKQEVNLFNSLFWIQRQWFFEYQISSDMSGDYLIFYSINPYRRKYYELSYPLNDTKRVFESIDHIQIGNQKVIDKCLYHFPRVKKVTFKKDFIIVSSESLLINLSSILSMEQLKTLIIKCNHFPFIYLMKFLSFAFNIQTLIFQTMPLYRDNKTTLENTELFQLVSRTNSVRNLSCRNKCGIDRVELLVMLFPRLQSLEMYLEKTKDMNLILPFLFNDNNQNTQQMILLKFLNGNNHSLRYFQHLINSGMISCKWKQIFINQQFYIWK
ncbi:hypothetical protein I4U23_021984 [Adineta vaga]|nr:hypothetical protein I4U23_021984 [Adineta vaga]